MERRWRRRRRHQPLPSWKMKPHCPFTLPLHSSHHSLYPEVDSRSASTPRTPTPTVDAPLSTRGKKRGDSTSHSLPTSPSPSISAEEEETTTSVEPLLTTDAGDSPHDADRLPSSNEGERGGDKEGETVDSAEEPLTPSTHPHASVDEVEETTTDVGSRGGRSESLVSPKLSPKKGRERPHPTQLRPPQRSRRPR